MRNTHFRKLFEAERNILYATMGDDEKKKYSHRTKVILIRHYGCKVTVIRIVINSPDIFGICTDCLG